MFIRIRRCAASAGVCALLFNLPAQAAELVLGHVSSITNPASASSAIQLRAGIQLALDAANANGGVNGNKVRLETRDDALDAQKMVALTNEFVADPQVIGLVGYLNTGGLTELAKADAFAKAGIALVAPYQGNANIVQASNVFPFRSGYTDELAALAKECKSTFKQKVAVVYYNIAFGPPMAKVAQEQLAAQKLAVSQVLEVDVKPNGDTPGTIAKAVATLAQSKPDAVILLAAGKPAFDFIAALRASSAALTPVYAMSVIVPDALVAAVGEKVARGVVLSQASPYPFVATSKLVTDYQRDLREHAPKQTPNFGHLEGYIAGRIALRGLRGAGAQPTRQSLLKALNNLGTYDLGGASVSYTPDARRGWGGTELVIISRDGKLLR
jgi:branched-chain amino acid transport system substrate-binding protein